MAARHDFSAGGVLRSGDDQVVLIVGRSMTGRRVVALPKGHPEEGETTIETALREVQEETGYVPQLAEPETATDIEYWFRDLTGELVHKHVRFYLMDVAGGDPADRDGEADEILVLSRTEALAQLTYNGERDAATQLLCD